MRTINTITMRTTRTDIKTGKVYKCNIPWAPLPENYHLFLMGDTHLGNKACSYKAIKRAVQTIKSFKNYRIGLQGDQLECIAVNDKRFDISIHEGRFVREVAQRMEFVELLDPVADGILWILDGNHERALKNGALPNAEMAQDWHTIYADGTFAKIVFPEWRLASWHGAGRMNSRAGDALQRTTNDLIALKRNLRSLPADDCDVITCGHYHKLRMHPPTSKQIMVTNADTNHLEALYTTPARIPISTDGETQDYRIHEDEKWYMTCGSFLRSYIEGAPTYSEDRGYYGAEMGFGHIEVRGGKPVKIETVPI